MTIIKFSFILSLAFLLSITSVCFAQENTEQTESQEQISAENWKLLKDLQRKPESLPIMFKILEQPTEENVAEAMDFVLLLDFQDSAVVSALLQMVRLFQDTQYKDIVFSKTLQANESCFEALRYILKVGSYADKKIAALLLGKRGEIEIDTFVELLKSISERDQEIAKEQLILGGSLVGLISRLAELVENNPQKTLHKNILEIFQAIGKTNIPALFFSLKSSGARAQQILTAAIVSQGQECIRPIIGVLRLNPDEELKKFFLEIAKQLGTSALMEVLSLINDTNPFIRDVAKVAVCNTGKEGLEFLLNILQTTSNPDEKLLAMNAFSTFGEDAKIGLQTIKKYLVIQDSLQYPAVLAVENMGDASKAVIPELMEAFKSEDWMVRVVATMAISHAGKAALPALSLLMRGIHVNSSGEPEEFYGEVRSAICKCIGNMGENAKDAVPHLIHMLQDVDENVVRSAAEALGKIGPRARAAIDPLIQVFSRYDSRVAEIVAKALSQLGPTVLPKAIRILRYSDDMPAKEGAAMICKYSGEQAFSAIDALITVLKFDIEDVKRQAAFALGAIGPISVNSMRALIEACKDESPYVREAVAESLGKMGVRVVPWIKNELRRNLSVENKITLIQALGHLGNTAYETLPSLLNELNYNKPEVQKEIVRTIIKVGGYESTSIMPLLQLLKKSTDSELHDLIREFFLGYGNSCIPEILTLFKEQSSYARQSAVIILDKMGEDAFPHLLRILREGKDEYLIEQLIPILGKKEIVLNDLLKLLDHPSASIHKVLVETLSQLGLHLVPRLIQIIQSSENEDELQTVRTILVKIGIPCLPQVTMTLRKEERPLSRQILLEIIGDLGNNATMAISVLVQLLAKVPKDERLSVAKCLGKIGSASLPYLVKLLYNPDKEIQAIAVVAMGETNSAEAVEYLLRSLEDPNTLSIVIEAIVKLRYLGVDILIRSLESQDLYTRFACVVALGHLKEDSKILKALQQQLEKEENSIIRYMIETVIK